MDIDHHLKARYSFFLQKADVLDNLIDEVREHPHFTHILDNRITEDLLLIALTLKNDTHSAVNNAILSGRTQAKVDALVDVEHVIPVLARAITHLHGEIAHTKTRPLPEEGKDVGKSNFPYMVAIAAVIGLFVYFFGR